MWPCCIWQSECYPILVSELMRLPHMPSRSVQLYPYSTLRQLKSIKTPFLRGDQISSAFLIFRSNYHFWSFHRHGFKLLTKTLNRFLIMMIWTISKTTVVMVIMIIDFWQPLQWDVICKQEPTYLCNVFNDIHWYWHKNLRLYYSQHEY